MLICLRKTPRASILLSFSSSLSSSSSSPEHVLLSKKKVELLPDFSTRPLKPERWAWREERREKGQFQISLLVKLSLQRSVSLNFGRSNMAPLYQSNGLERAHPRWHTNQSPSITGMTDFPIINTPCCAAYEITPCGFCRSFGRESAARRYNIYIYTCGSKSAKSMHSAKQIYSQDSQIIFSRIYSGVCVCV